MNSKTHQSRDQTDWFRYWKIHLSTDDVWKEKEFLSRVSKGTGGLSEDKESIRGRLLEERSGLSISDAVEKSHSVYLNLISLDRFKLSRRIALYSPVRGEVRTDSIFHKAIEDGKEVYFPKVMGNSLSFHRVRDLGELRPGQYGIPEPPSGASSIEARDLDLLLVPGVAFDQKGARLGYGGGYYDRIAGDVEPGRRVGILYKFQLQKSIPTECHDIQVGTLVHEQGIVFCSGKSGGD